MVQANEDKICLGDTYDAVKEIKGFPEKVSFIKISEPNTNEAEALTFEAVSFYDDDMLYIFESANSRLCLISDGAKDLSHITCKESSDKRQCS